MTDLTQIYTADNDQAPVIDDTPVVQEPAPSTWMPEEPQAPLEEAAVPSEEAAALVNPLRAKQNVLQDQQINAAEHLSAGDELVLPSQYDKETREAIEHIPNINLLDTPKARAWAADVTESLDYNTMAEGFVKTLEDPEAEFHQAVVHNGARLAGQSPRMKSIEGENISGERAVIRMINHLGLGTLFQVPLWHSGFWITLKPPTEMEMVELNRLLMADKIQFGRATYGMAFANSTAYTTDRLVNFVLEHVYDLTVRSEDINTNNLREHIMAQDIPSLLWGFICTMYPRGFRYRRPCTTDPEKCNHVLEATLNVHKLQWTNIRGLTEWQKAHMSYRSARSRDLTMVTRYKEEMARMQKRTETIGTHSPISMVLKAPTVKEYIESGHRWIGDIVTVVDRVLGAEASTAERNALITRHAQASSLRQYVHWIDSFEFSGNTVDDKETIETNLALLSSDDEIRPQIMEKVVNFINQSSISVIGIPTYDCPACGNEQKPIIALPRHTNIIPLDVIQLFFGLHIQKLEKIRVR